jgi:hypothetical protein
MTLHTCRVFPTGPDDDHSGLTIREYAAVKIMAGFAATRGGLPEEPTKAGFVDRAATGRVAVAWAEALIAALNESDNPGK